MSVKRGYEERVKELEGRVRGLEEELEKEKHGN